MARRGGDFKDQLNSLLRTTLAQLDSVKDAVVQRGKAGKIQLDLTLLKRKRRDALADLGEVVATLAEEGRLDEDDFPELSSGLARLSELDERIETEERRARAVAAGLPEDMEMPDWRRRQGRGAGDEDEEPTEDLEEGDDLEEYERRAADLGDEDDAELAADEPDGVADDDADEEPLDEDASPAAAPTQAAKRKPR